jgi:hypothetical protein
MQEVARLIMVSIAAGDPAPLLRGGRWKTRTLTSTVNTEHADRLESFC